MARPGGGADHLAISRCGHPFEPKVSILKQHGMRRRNIIAAALLLVLTVGYGALTTQVPIRNLPGTPGPSFFPWINTFVLLALSLGLLVQGLRGKTAGDGGQPVTSGDASERWRAIWPSPWRFLPPEIR